MSQITVEKYRAMIDAGILTEDDPVELLDGYLVEKTAKTPPHRVATGSTRKALEQIVPAEWYLDTHAPITTMESEPEPDVTVVRGGSDDFSQRHPGPDDVGLLVEVSEATLAHDRGPKKRIYARAKIAVYWIVNLVDRQIEVHADPTGPAEQPEYRQKQIYKPGESIPVVLGGNEIGTLEVTALLP
jgi:Uma2 family endonuclease